MVVHLGLKKAEQARDETDLERGWSGLDDDRCRGVRWSPFILDGAQGKLRQIPSTNAEVFL
jgi:hypothetical protein